MHAHGTQGRKLHRDRDKRRALLKGLATSLVMHGAIETTLPKAKELVPYIEKLITKAKIGDLHNRRQIRAAVTTVEATHKLIDQIAPKLAGRNSGHVRIVRTKLRLGDNAQLARVEFVDDITVAEQTPAAATAEKGEEK